MSPNMIDSYSFGRIIIDGRRYTNDVIILPNRVMDNWWRKEGHSLQIDDLKEVLKEEPEVLIVGTGRWGLMKVPAETRNHVESKGIELIAQSTKEACETYNRFKQSGKKVVAALHLSC
jgi:hypothetical protein